MATRLMNDVPIPNNHRQSNNGSTPLHPSNEHQTTSARNRGRSDDGTNGPALRWWHLWVYLSVLALDLISSLLLLTPLLPRIMEWEDLTKGSYSLHGTLWDLAALALPRTLTALLVIIVSYHRLDNPLESSSSSSPFELYHKNGEPKSTNELEEEALEEPYWPKIKRHVLRMPFLCEFSVFATGVLISLKCLARLNYEIGFLGNSKPQHPVFWAALGLTAIVSLAETSYIDAVEKHAGALGRKRRRELEELSSPGSWVERISESLAQPLLSRVNSEMDTDDEEQLQHEREGAKIRVDDANVRGRSGIKADAEYAAKWSDLLAFCNPDKHLILTASLFLVAASVANVFVPKLTGEVLDALISHSVNSNTTAMKMLYADDNGHTNSSNGSSSIVQIPGFLRNIQLLLLVSVLGGVFEGVRGMIFTIVGARVNVRLRINLMDSLLSQEIGFFDTTLTGVITSRLSSDTTIVGSSITNNVNTFLRSIVRAVGVLIFIFFISWQLTILAFVTIPCVSILSKWYGRYIRRLTKLQQKKLADGNSVSESSISSMATVRAFGAESVELTEFEECMKKYLVLNQHTAVATFGYYTCVGALPELVKAIVLFYGGLLVQAGSMTGGQLVSFILYLSSLSSAFSSLGGVYASLVRAVGASDKVFELMNRKPQLTPPSHVDEERIQQAIARRKKPILGVESTKVVQQGATGCHPGTCRGEITLKDVVARYPARPQRVVLNGLNLHIPAGSIVALVGPSGSGKSSIVKLIQHLYEPSAGRVLIDDKEVHELSPEFISRVVSVVQQEPTLMARSIKRNIMYGLEGTEFEPTQEAVEEAARLANASSFVEAFPEGYETEVGERGIQLSGGQKQRIAIARALFRRPKILLLDEATSALDSESEHVVQAAIDNMISGQRSLDGDPSRTMTVVIVAHRLSTVRNADRIFVIHSGTVVEEGSHDELILNEGGVYSGLIRRQLGDMH